MIGTQFPLGFVLANTAPPHTNPFLSESPDLEMETVLSELLWQLEF